MSAKQRFASAVPVRHGRGTAHGNDYDRDTDERTGTPFNLDGINMDSLAAATHAVLAAGDMVSYTMDREGYSVKVTVYGDAGPIAKWCNDVETFDKYMLRLYDKAISRLNARKPPTLPIPPPQAANGR